MSIVTKAMLVSIHVGMWTGQRLDKRASARVVRDANAAADAARVNKHLVPKAALAPIVEAAGKLRKHFYATTLPWRDNGDRLLPRAAYHMFVEGYAPLKDEFEAAVDQFLNVTYPTERDRAEFRMGDMFDPGDYPTPLSLAHRFYTRVEVNAVPDAGDFRVELDADESRRIRDEIADNVNTRLRSAVTDLWDRLYDTLEAFAERMASDTKFYDTTVSNLQALARAVPALNVTDDPDLARLADRLADRAALWDPKEIRADRNARDAAAEEAREVLDEMSDFMVKFRAVNGENSGDEA